MSARIQQYLENNYFKLAAKKPLLHIWIKPFNHKYFENLEVIVDINEQTIEVLTQELSNGPLDGESVCIIKRSFSDLNDEDACALIGNIYKVFKSQ